MPEREKLHLMARSQSTMCIFLSAGIAEQVQEELLQEYPETTPRSCLLPPDMERRTNIQGRTQGPCQDSEGK